MTPYAVSEGHISAESQALFLAMRSQAEALPNIEDDEIFSCHSICEAFAKVFPVLHRFGHFGKSCEHSWLVPEQQPNDVVMDMYPVAGSCPFIVYTGAIMPPWGYLYREGELERDKSVWERQANKITPFLTSI